ncbi:hypothetical protein NEISICOT_02797 [Neisseria sicca ATCC 29256]|uniref:Uncharacterized protein n=1 Tax=Neisseria sicca ATCC 29256 TaxID=547045 RepID=C6M8C9_NEISI|nr:hypothetical protein NEISICOT_02797 [Neisseria sicca ATCC 29256]
MSINSLFCFEWMEIKRQAPALPVYLNPPRKTAIEIRIAAIFYITVFNQALADSE